jgi:hypothetical protein
MFIRKERNMDHTKSCRRCNIVKPLSEFNLDSKSKDKKQCYCKICNREKNKSWHSESTNHKERKIKWVENNREYVVNNVWARIAHNIRCTNRYIVKKINSVSDERVQKWLGINREGFKQHMENLFKPGMTWENHGEWHLDHKKSLDKFKDNLTDKKCIDEANHYTNIQPMWAEDNSKKYNK